MVGTGNTITPKGMENTFHPREHREGLGSLHPTR
jgi:hypothetical protein